MLDTLFANILALLILMIAGGGLNKLGLISKVLRQELNRLLYYFALPLLVFRSMRGSITLELLQNSYLPLFFGIALAIINGAVAFGLGAATKIDKKERRLFGFLNMFGNNLYLALPIAEALFGGEGVAIVLLYSFGSDLVLWTIGQHLLSTNQQLRFRNLKQVFSPTMLALILGSLAGVIGLWLPLPLEMALSNVASITSPLALLLTGASLAEINLREKKHFSETALLTVARLLISPMIAFLVLSLFTTSGNETIFTTLIILAGMPTFVRSIVLSDRHGWDSQKTALGVLATHLGCFLTIPLILRFLAR